MTTKKSKITLILSKIRCCFFERPENGTSAGRKSLQTLYPAWDYYLEYTKNSQSSEFHER